jgi:predicted transporter
MASFMSNVLIENGTERALVNVLLIFGIIVFAFNVLESYLNKTLKVSIAKIPSNIKAVLMLCGTIFNYFLLIPVIILLYYSWQDDWAMTSFIIGLLLTIKVVEWLYGDKEEV